MKITFEELPVEISMKIEKVMRAKKIGFADAVLFLLNEVVSPRPRFFVVSGGFT